MQAFLALLQQRLHESPPTRAEALATARLVAAFARLLLLLQHQEGQGQGYGGVGALLSQLAALSDRALSKLGCV